MREHGRVFRLGKNLAVYRCRHLTVTGRARGMVQGRARATISLSRVNARVRDFTPRGFSTWAAAGGRFSFLPNDPTRFRWNPQGRPDDDDDESIESIIIYRIFSHSIAPADRSPFARRAQQQKSYVKNTVCKNSDFRFTIPVVYSHVIAGQR